MPGHFTPCIALTTLSVCAAATLTGIPARAIQAELCFGQVPTIVGKPGREIVGTEGADVVITNDAYFTQTGPGNDLVCITGMDAHEDGVNAGDGDDRVDSTAASTDFSVEYGISLGDGSDELIGGPRGEAVWGGSAFSDDSDRDVISTAAGRDNVYNVAGDDVVDLGPGKDGLVLAGHSAGPTIRGVPATTRSYSAR
jgi:hypothetical protein